MPFCINDKMISRALGIDEEVVKESWKRLEEGGFIMCRQCGDCQSFILGSRQP